MQLRTASRQLSVRLPDAVRAVTVPALALTAAYVADRVTRPLLCSTSEWQLESLNAIGESACYRLVTLGNAGLGSALVQDVSFSCRFDSDSDSGSDSDLSGLDAAALRLVLRQRLGLIDGVDYALANHTSGSVLAPGEDRVVFEAREEALSRLTVLEARFRVTSLLGRRYSKTVSLLPHPAASAAVLRADVEHCRDA